MSDFSLTLVLQIKTSKIINDMAKVQQKSEKITAFGGILFVLDKFDSILSSVIDSHLGLRSTLIGYQYSEIIRAIFSVFCCGGDCMEDLNLYLKDVLTERPHTRVPSADTVLRGIEQIGELPPSSFQIFPVHEKKKRVFFVMLQILRTFASRDYKDNFTSAIVIENLIIGSESEE